MASVWRLIQNGTLSAALNMALDETLWHSVRTGQSPPVLRLYRWQPAAVSLGYGQKGADIVNLQACSSLGFDVVRRITGGRAVLHDNEVTYAVVSQEHTELFSGGVLACYKTIAEILKQTLESFGLPVELAPGQPRAIKGKHPSESACFTAVSHYELICQGCKIAGSSQKRGNGTFLQHGSIPLDLDLDILHRVLTPEHRVGKFSGIDVYGRRVGWVNRWASERITIDRAEESLINAFGKSLNIEFISDSFTPSEWQRARELAAEKYDNPAWNLAGV